MLVAFFLSAPKSTAASLQIQIDRLPSALPAIMKFYLVILPKRNHIYACICNYYISYKKGKLSS